MLLTAIMPAIVTPIAIDFFIISLSSFYIPASSDAESCHLAIAANLPDDAFASNKSAMQTTPSVLLYPYITP